jgi:hypothetical protein
MLPRALLKTCRLQGSNLVVENKGGEGRGGLAKKILKVEMVKKLNLW